jgi:hypothetical protein
MKSLFLAITAVFCLTFLALAADVSGKWTADIPGRGGNTMTNTFTFKSAGDKVEGTVATQRGEAPIADGKLDGDTLTFTVTRTTQRGEMKSTYTGTVKGDSIDFTVDNGRGPQTFTAKKAQ